MEEIVESIVDTLREIDKSNRRSICRMCFKNFRRLEGHSKNYCSTACHSKKSGRRCKPTCLVSDRIDVEVEFKNGTKHIKSVCGKCRRSFGYVKNPASLAKKDKPPKNFDPFENTISVVSKTLKAKFGDGFYTGKAWLRIRYQVLKEQGPICALCGSKEKPMHVDHIKPRSRYPELSLDKRNLQVLCAACNIGKGSDDETDFRNNDSTAGRLRFRPETQT